MNRHRIIYLETMPDGRDVLFAMSCRVNETSAFGVVVDFGTGDVWDIDGEMVRFDFDGTISEQRMDVHQDMLSLGGREAIEAFTPALLSNTVAFATKQGFTAAFKPSDEATKTPRFMQLCELN